MIDLKEINRLKREQHEGALCAKAFKCNRCRHIDIEVINVGGYREFASIAFPMYRCRKKGLHLRKMTKCPMED